MTKDDNPIPGPAPDTYEEAYFNDEAAYALYDAYLMLLDLGFEPESCKGIRTVINQTTIYSDEDVEYLHEVSE
jgi:hypothetical protein